MSITITTDVFCDHCADWCDGVSDGLKIRIKDARNQAKGMGWKRVLDDGAWIDLCPDCYAKWESGELYDDEIEMPPHHELNEKEKRVLSSLGYYTGNL